MKNKTKMLLFILLLIAIFTNGHLVPFQPERLRLVDVVNDNYLFRSGSPLTIDMKRVNYTGIIATMKELTNNDFPNNFVMYDISLLNPSVWDDKVCLDIERSFFNESMINYAIRGEHKSPWGIHHKKYKTKTFPEWSRDRLPYFVDFIEFLMFKKYDQPHIFLVHCMQGVDRTGEVIGAYKMKRFGTSLTDIIQEDYEINNDHKAPRKKNMNGLLWYNLWYNK